MGADLRYGFIGTGMMGREHLADVAALPGARPVAVADTDEGSRRSAREAVPGLEVHADARDLLERDDLDVVVISTPNHTHRAVLDLVWGTSLHVLIEKPLCTTIDDARHVRDAAETHPGIVWMGLEYRFMPPVHRFVEELRSGRAGQLRMLSIREHRFPFLAKVGDWNRFNRNTGGTLVEKCCHFFDLMNLCLDDHPVRLYASGGQDVNHLDETYAGERPDILDNAFVILEYPKRVRATLDLCMFAEGSSWQEQIAVTGDAARIEAFVPGPARFSPDGRERASEIEISPRATKRPVREEIHVDERILAAGDHHGSTYFQHAKFLDIVRHGGRPEVTLEDGMKAVLIGAAAEESARTGRAVEVER